MPAIWRRAIETFVEGKSGTYGNKLMMSLLGHMFQWGAGGRFLKLWVQCSGAGVVNDSGSREYEHESYEISVIPQTAPEIPSVIILRYLLYQAAH
jgi:hypothetical protein